MYRFRFLYVLVLILILPIASSNGVLTDQCPVSCQCKDLYGDKFMDCSYVLHTHIPECPLGVKYVNLENNFLPKLNDNAFQNCRNVSTLWLSFSGIKDIHPGAFNGVVDTIKYLYLSDNPLSDEAFDVLLKIVIHMKNLKYLYIINTNKEKSEWFKQALNKVKPNVKVVSNMHTSHTVYSRPDVPGNDTRPEASSVVLLIVGIIGALLFIIFCLWMYMRLRDTKVKIELFGNIL